MTVIGTATEAEFAERLENHAAVSGHAHALRVEATSVDETAAILDTLKSHFEADYGLTIAPDSLKETARLAGRYLTTAPLPASAVQLLHRACAAVKMSAQSNLTVKAGVPGDQALDAEDVMVTVSQMTGIPVNKLGADERARYANMVEYLHQRIIGQEEAVLAVSRAVKTARVGLKDPKRPIGSFFFLGPTGVGKTELAKAVAECLFGDEKKMVRIDMSEYQDGAVSVDKLIGMPRGIVGSERGGLLTNQLKDNPYTVVLLDEVEKASPGLLNLFLQAFDEGWLTDGRGKRVYLSDAVVIMTSNIGSECFRKLTSPLGFLSGQVGADQVQGEIMRELERRFPPEFRNRIDETVVFAPLTHDEVREIAKQYLLQVRVTLASAGKTIQVDADALEQIVKDGYSLAYGARFLKRVIDEQVKLPISERWREGSHFHVHLKDGHVTAEPAPARMLTAQEAMLYGDVA
ncbi:MAG: AAA family ATPase [Betaproteobacteria bacterium]